MTTLDTLLEAHRPRAAASAPPLALPDYAGGSLVNLPPTVGSLLGADAPWAAPPLADVVARHQGIRKVVLLVVDGVGHDRLSRELDAGGAGLGDAGPGDLLSRHSGVVGSITSVSPSTTAVATTVLNSDGSTPAALGTFGYLQRLPKLGVVANMLFWRPGWALTDPAGSLERWGLEPETFLPAPSIYQRLGAAGVRTTAVMPAPFVSTPLTRMQLRGATLLGASGVADTLRLVGDVLKENRDGPAYAYGYLTDFDTVSHRDGPDGPSWSFMFRSFVRDLADVIAALPPRARDGTLLLITADHGHATVPPSGLRPIQSQPRTWAALGLREGGEARHAHLYARPGAEDELLEAAREEYGREFYVLRGADALEAGLYGDPHSAHAEALDRIGEVVVLATGPVALWDDALPGRMIGMHGALDRSEMLVPLIELRLDA